MRQLPADLQETLILHMTKPLYENLPIASTVAPEYRDSIITQLCLKATSILVRRGTLIATHRELAQEGRLFLIVSGRVQVTDQIRTRVAESQHMILARGDFFGFLEAGGRAWGRGGGAVDPATVALEDSAIFVAQRSSELAMLTRDHLEEIIPLLPPEAQESLLRVPESLPLFSHHAIIFKSQLSGGAKALWWQT
jgi:CRP-like cAMP-binding protein